MIQKFKKSKKESSQTIFFSIFLGIVVLVIIGLLIFSNWKISQKRAELSSQIESLKKEIKTLEEKKQKLEAGISQTKKREYLEEVAFEQLGKKPPGTEVLVITKEKEEEKKVEEKEKGFWNPQTWWQWLKSKIW